MRERESKNGRKEGRHEGKRTRNWVDGNKYDKRRKNARERRVNG